jgi:pimeloyl-ACP methyl ester carboxylesterase
MPTVRANGLTFSYLEQGSGPLVLLVHGFPDTAHTWNRVMPDIAAAGFRAVAPFTRGIAPTEIPADGQYGADTLGADVVALIDALGESNAVVVGHDWGASAAYSAATLAPERVRTLVTLAIPHPGGLIPTPRLIWLVRHFFTLPLPGAAQRVRRKNFAHVDELVHRWSPSWAVPEGETDPAKAAYRVEGCLDAALGYYRALRPWLPKAQRLRITVPSFAFAGEDDPFPASAWELARSRFTGPYTVIRMPGGHFMHREHPERFSKELLRILQGV